jgi:hypothetical protein
MTRNDYTLVQTCGACPEQYDVMLEGSRVGYLRLRHGSFRADYRCGGVNATVFEARPRGDGAFEDDERNHYLNAAIEAIDARHHGVLVVENAREREEPRGWTLELTT